VIISLTSSATTALLEARVDVDAAEYVIVLQVTTPPGEAETCPLHAKCDFCSILNGDDSCQTLKTDFAEESFTHQNLTKYASEVEYHCGAGRRFKVNNGTDDVFLESVSRSCDWEGQWQPEYDLPVCECKTTQFSTYKVDTTLKKLYCISLYHKGTSCINPPVPPNGTHLVMGYTEGEEIQFHESVSYSCEPGHFFIENYDLQSFSLKCLPGGQWETPSASEWKACIHPDGQR
jgi:hypothetical protein